MLKLFTARTKEKVENSNKRDNIITKSNTTMKQTYLKSLFLSLLMIVVGNIGALAGEEVISFSADTDKGSVTNNGQTSTGDQITKSGVTIFSSNGCLGSGSYRVYTNGNLSISTTEGNITKVEITCNGTTDGNKDYNPNKFTLNSGSTGSYSGSGYIGTWTGEATSVVLDASAQVRMSKIEVTVNTGESNKILKGIMLSGEYPTTFFVGDEFSFGETGTVTAVYDDNSTKVVTDKAMFSGYDMSTVSNQTVTVSYTEGEVTVTTTYDITVKEAPAFHYEKVTTAPSDWNGEYLIVYEGGSLAFDGGLSTLDAIGNTISVTIKDNKIASSEAVDAATFTIAKNDAGTYSNNNLYCFHATCLLRHPLRGASPDKKFCSRLSCIWQFRATLSCVSEHVRKGILILSLFVSGKVHTCQSFHIRKKALLV